MFRFAYAKMNNGMTAAAANCAEAASSCAAANTNDMMKNKVMDAALAASILIISLRIDILRVWVLGILGLLILAGAAHGRKTQGMY